MNDLTGKMWQSCGTSLVWDATELHALAAKGRTVSLHEALGWLPSLPDEPPGDARCILVTGLSTVLDVLPVENADVLLTRIRRLILKQNQTWPESAMVFTVTDGTRLRVHPASEELSFTLHGGQEIAIGRSLWGGAASDMRRIVTPRTDAKLKKSNVPVGYWLRRVA